MPLRRSPALTPAALWARRLNSLKSTGPRTARGKAWSCLNALRHGERSRRRTFRDKLARTGDAEAVYFFDFIFEELLRSHENPSEFVWRRLESLAVRAWCIESGRRGRKVAKTCLRTKLESGVGIYRYAANFVVPRRLTITNKAGWGFALINPAPSRRRRARYGWVPDVEDLEGKPPKARRVREDCKSGSQIVRRVPPQCRAVPSGPSGGSPQADRSRWDAICKAAGRIGSAILGTLGWKSASAVAAVSSRPEDLRAEAAVRTPPSESSIPVAAVSSGPEDLRAEAAVRTPPLQHGSWWRPRDPLLEDLEDYESESPEEFLFRHKVLARIAMAAARHSRRTCWK